MWGYWPVLQVPALGPCLADAGNQPKSDLQRHGTHVQLEGDDGGHVVQHARKAADEDGSPGVDGGAAGCDSYKAGKGSVAHDHDIIGPASCMRHSCEPEDLLVMVQRWPQAVLDWCGVDTWLEKSCGWSGCSKKHSIWHGAAHDGQSRGTHQAVSCPGGL